MLYRRRTRFFWKRNNIKNREANRHLLLAILILAGLFFALVDHQSLVFDSVSASPQRFDTTDLSLPRFLQQVERAELLKSMPNLPQIANVNRVAWGGRSPNLDFKPKTGSVPRNPRPIAIMPVGETEETDADPIRINSRFGFRRSGQGFRHHDGIDVAMPHGAPIRAIRSGIVTFVGWRQGYGNTVIIDHGGGKETLYAHASTLLVEPGRKIEKGEAIARVGNTGRSFGAHLHFEIRRDGVPVDPEDEFLAAKAAMSELEGL